MHSPHRFLIAALLLSLSSLRASAEIREVGVGKAFKTLEDAYEYAKPGDSIRIHALPNGRAYEKVALAIDRPNMRFIGVPNAEGKYPRISGKDFSYSGVGKIPRAIFQFNPTAHGGRVMRLDISGAHNESHNGAAVRINAANEVTIQECDIHDNDMGIMSNGDLDKSAGANQRIDRCHIHHNGDKADPGFNHNLYLGGTSVFVLACEIDSATTGHNLKSRAHYTHVEGCYIHDSANRECDFVDDAKTTLAENSHTTLMNCVIVKGKEVTGNRDVIHFGQDGSNAHNGTLYLIHNTIITPYISPVVTLSTRGSSLEMYNNIIYDGGAYQKEQVVVSARDGAALEKVIGSHNWLSAGFVLPQEGTFGVNMQGTKDEKIGFRASEKGDYTLPEKSPLRGAGKVWNQIRIPNPQMLNREQIIEALLQYSADRMTRNREKVHLATLGAFE